MSYKYETHLHTAQGSACGVSSGTDYIEPYFNAGYSGIFVTDHFFGGNTAAPKDAHWETRVKVYCSGYEAAFNEAISFNNKNNLTGTDKEFKVFFGIEQTFDGDDYLIYGIDKNWLLNHPEIENMNHSELFHAVNSVGGLMIQAHPFRFRSYQTAMHQHPLDVHGIEIYNGGNKIIENQMAELYAKAMDFPTTSGSDIHNVSKLINHEGIPCGGMEFTTPLQDAFDYGRRVKAKNYKLIGIEK